MWYKIHFCPTLSKPENCAILNCALSFVNVFYLKSSWVLFWWNCSQAVAHVKRIAPISNCHVRLLLQAGWSTENCFWSPDISRQFGSECPCYCSCGFIKVHWLHLSFKNNFYLVTQSFKHHRKDGLDCSLPLPPVLPQWGLLKDMERDFEKLSLHIQVR